MVESTYPPFEHLILQIPLFLVWLAGIVVSLVYGRRYPKVAVLTTIAFGLLLATGLFVEGLMMAEPLLRARWQAQFILIDIVVLAAGLVQSLAAGAALVLLLVAAFGFRTPANKG